MAGAGADSVLVGHLTGETNRTWDMYGTCVLMLIKSEQKQSHNTMSLKPCCCLALQNTCI